MNEGHDEGFTLIELLISISITVIILSSTSASLVVFLSNGKYVMKRDDHNAAAVLLSSYLDRDFASATTATPLDPPATCTSPSTVLTLAWQDYSATAAAPTPVAENSFTSTYVVSSDVADDLGDATCKLTRTYSRTSPATVTTVLSTEILVHNMPANAFSASRLGTCGAGRAVTANLAQYSTDTAGLAYTYRGCVNVRQAP